MREKIFASAITDIADVPQFIDTVRDKGVVELAGSATEVLHVVLMVRKYASVVADSDRREQAIRVIACGHGGLIGQLCDQCADSEPEMPGMARRSIVVIGE